MTMRPNESTRLEELQRLMILDSTEETAYDDITRMASGMFGVPISLISLVDSDRQWFKSKQGITASETPRSWSFCSHAIEEPDEVFVVEDATKDDRFKDNPLVTGAPNIRYYAGAPLVTKSGAAIGSLCIIDSKPRDIPAEKLKELQFLADQVIEMMEKRVEFSGLFGEGKESK